MEVTAKLRFLRMSPHKVRLVANMVRGLPVDKAESQLEFSSKNAALPLKKLLLSAVANAENNNKLSKENLFIKQIFVNEGPALKRWRPRAFGRASELKKRSSHITVIVEELKKGQLKKRTIKTKKDEIKKELAKKSVKVKQEVVDFKAVKHESKFDKQGAGPDEKAEEKRKPAFSFKNIKDKFTRRIGE